MMPITLQIDITVPLSDEQIEYIFDCWINFVTLDLGLQPNEAIMHEVEGVAS